MAFAAKSNENPARNNGPFYHDTSNPEWSRDAKFATFLARKQNEAELDRIVTGWTKD